jgi:hypothetical protein
MFDRDTRFGTLGNAVIEATPNVDSLRVGHRSLDFGLG